LRYFEFDADNDVDAIVALFADNATVVDEGHTLRGTSEIRAWRTGTVATYSYTTEV